MLWYPVLDDHYFDDKKNKCVVGAITFVVACFTFETWQKWHKNSFKVANVQTVARLFVCTFLVATEFWTGSKELLAKSLAEQCYRAFIWTGLSGSFLYHLFHQPYLKEQVWGKHPWLQFLCTAPQILMSFIKGNKFKVHIKSTSKYACAQPTYFQRL